MRLCASYLVASLALAAGCAQQEAVVDLTVTDATPAVPIRALQFFELDPAGNSAGSSGFIGGGDVEMPNRMSMSFFDEAPPPFRICVVALGDGDDVLLHAVSESIQPILDETVAVVLPLALVEPGGEVPEPCGPEIPPWPDDV